MVRKIGVREEADIAFMSAMGYSSSEVAEELDVSTRTVQRHLSGFKERAEEIGVQQAFIEIVLRAGPDYALFRLTPVKRTLDEVLENLGRGGE